ncbi:hypothetical protein Pla100_31740 [Neorhodopirellula pilleata]|uniref:Uncharacterized protein n=1 Tax=Neorhodopirellula pilleata TaxID=2714738 RepID=A0A5C6AB25_9BACT|nr:hypothetical protein Pla100_31740 [Neorhodopirellula pilleata]
MLNEMVLVHVLQAHCRVRAPPRAEHEYEYVSRFQCAFAGPWFDMRNFNGELAKDAPLNGIPRSRGGLRSDQQAAGATTALSVHLTIELSQANLHSILWLLLIRLSDAVVCRDRTFESLVGFRADAAGVGLIAEGVRAKRTDQ